MHLWECSLPGDMWVNICIAFSNGSTGVSCVRTGRSTFGLCFLCVCVCEPTRSARASLILELTFEL